MMPYYIDVSDEWGGRRKGEHMKGVYLRMVLRPSEI
jgi:hypothetical protein